MLTEAAMMFSKVRVALKRKISLRIVRVYVEIDYFCIYNLIFASTSSSSHGVMNKNADDF